ncbi:MAG: hypothetical protein HY748_10490 [Elusimicrobia bacterium]|nr:hypothetical protein [Elusimicrobiota bacterium]
MPRTGNAGGARGPMTGIIPVHDASPVNRANVSKTCGKCHPGAGPQLTKGFVHGPGRRKHWSLQWAAIFYLVVIPLAIGGMLLQPGT